MREFKKCQYHFEKLEDFPFDLAKSDLTCYPKKGISAPELQSALAMKYYDTAWTLLHKIRETLRQCDEIYMLHNILGLDGAVFSKRHTGNQAEVLVAVEAKDWMIKKVIEKLKLALQKC